MRAFRTEVLQPPSAGLYTGCTCKQTREWRVGFLRPACFPDGTHMQILLF